MCYKKMDDFGGVTTIMSIDTLKPGFPVEFFNLHGQAFHDIQWPEKPNDGFGRSEFSEKMNVCYKRGYSLYK